jgi:ankyrin repeat protein
MNCDELQQGIQDNLPIPDRNELWEAIEKGDLEKYTPKQIEQGMLQKEYEKNLYHKAAYHGHLDKIPKELLTAENLLKTDTFDRTCLHLAAYNGQLAEIPREVLTAENLLKHDKNGDTCLNLAAQWGHLDKLPWLSYETLTELTAHFENQSSSYRKEEILKTLNDLLEKKLKKLEIIARSLTINHDTNIL